MTDNDLVVIPPGYIFSQSSLQDYCACPRRFRLRHVERLSWPTLSGDQHAIQSEKRRNEGIIFHKMIHQFFLGLPKESLQKMATSINLRRWWQNFLKIQIDTAGWKLHPEMLLSKKICNHHLAAKYDLVLTNKEKTIIFDWKTSRKRPSIETMRARMQSKVYPMVLTEREAKDQPIQLIAPDSIEMRYWFSEFPEESMVLPYSAGLFAQDKDELEHLIFDISHRKMFPMTTNERECSYCFYASYCNKSLHVDFSDETNQDLIDDIQQDLEYDFQHDH